MRRIRALGKRLADTFWTAITNWSHDDVPRLGASLAYYTLFSIAPVLIVAIAIGGMVFGPDAVRGKVVEQLEGLLGHDGAQAIQSLLKGASRSGGTTTAVLLGSGTFLITATGAFLELQHALNVIFRVKADPPKSAIVHFLKNRLRSFSIVIAIGFLLLVSLTVNAGLAAMSSWLNGYAWGGKWLWTVLNFVASLLVIVLLFALVYKFLPDAHIRWRDAWLGAGVTAIMFTIGKEFIGQYIGHGNWTTTYGTIGSILVLILWIYYSSQVVLFGAEVTREFATSRGAPPKPRSFAKPNPDAHPDAKRARQNSRRRKTPSHAHTARSQVR